MLIFVDDLEIARKLGKASQYLLKTQDYVESAWLLGMSTFRTLGGCLGLSDDELEDIAHDVEFLEDHMDKNNCTLFLRSDFCMCLDEQRASRN